ncbi:MAG TPA: hypothetical protein VFR03_18150 [Thermoanaerobaculia bacterium]|nr:hypothetical protein [Thermoanaerobaculia bacterium]
MTRHVHVLPLTLLLLSLVACGQRETAAPAPEASSSANPPSMAETTATAPSGQPAGDAGVAPLSPHAGLIDPQANSQQAAGAAGSIDFDLPKGWQSQKVTSSMRLVQTTVPGPGGNGDFAVFYFGPGGGGPVDANIERWVGQVEGASKPTPETFETNGYKVTWVDVKGTLKPSGMGMGPSSPVPNARLYGAVVEGPGGPWFFKATGPDATLGPQRDAFVGMLKSVRAKK